MAKVEKKFKLEPIYVPYGFSKILKDKTGHTYATIKKALSGNCQSVEAVEIRKLALEYLKSIK